MSTPANYATLIAEIDAIVDDFNLSIFQVFGGKPSNLVSLMQLIDLRYKLFEAGGGAGAIVLAVFKAVGDGTGYSIDDIIILRQTPPAAAEWYNATTGSVIATPDPADLGSVSSASNVSVLSSALPTGASTSALQSAIQANAGSDASKAIAVQGVTNGKAIPVSLGVALPAGSNTIGAISNTSFGISGTLPAFASAPTVNIGTAPNIAIIGVADGEPVGINNAHVIHNESQLSAPSSTSSRNMNGFNRAFITATVANINTNVVLRIEGSNDNSNWVNLSASDADTTITANGTYGFQYVGCPQHIRTTFVSESGGTSATVDVITRLSA